MRESEVVVGKLVGRPRWYVSDRGAAWTSRLRCFETESISEDVVRDEDGELILKDGGRQKCSPGKAAQLALLKQQASKTLWRAPSV